MSRRRANGLAAAIAAGLIAVATMAPPAAAEDALWLPSLETETPQAGFDLAVTLARKAVKTAQPDVTVLQQQRPTYARDADSLIAVSQTVAAWFATVAAANEYWAE